MRHNRRIHTPRPFTIRLLLVLAIMSGLCAATLARVYLFDASKKQVTITVEAEKTDMTTIVVAKQPLHYGMELSRGNLEEIDWPREAMPEEAIKHIDDLLGQKGKVVALSYMAVGEPVFRWKVTGPGQRASLSAMVNENRKAVSIRINEVLGVGGFVLPGDHVDVLLTRISRKKTGSQELNQSYTDLLLQNIRVLAVDQLADDKSDKPTLAKTVTVEVDIADAQKLALAATVGTLSLTLRRAGAMAADNARRITLSDLTLRPTVQKTKVKVDSAAKAPRNDAAVITVRRALEQSEYSVRRE